MNLLHRIEYWGEHHHPKWLDLVRIALGIFLCYKGVQFMRNTGVLIDLMSDKMSFGQFTLVLLSHYIVFAHIMGGFLLALGLLTRFACLIQIPILLGAIVFVNAAPDMMQPFSELIVSIVVLLLLIYFLIAGNGPWSFDWFVEREKQEA
jgi:uncharacterized membrane protein YphA (DoxX/SURF4 family)